MLSFVVPRSDLDEFYNLPEDVQSGVRLLLLILQRIHAADRTVAQAKDEARRYHGRRGFSSKSLLRKYYAYRETSDWHVLANGSKLNAAPRELPAEFVPFWRGLCDRYKRKCKAAYRELLRMWVAGEYVDGYGCWQEWWQEQHEGQPLPLEPPADLPDGWSYPNLMKYAPDKIERTLTRRGIAAARQLMPSVISTREGLRPFEYVVFDDAETDFHINDAHSGQICKVEGLFCKDVATDMWLRFGIRPGIIREEDGKRDGLKRRDMLELVAQLLTTYGYPRDYDMHLIVERGTATINDADEAALYEMTGGKVRVHRTSMISGTVLDGGYRDAPVGNFRGKSWIESGFNLLHNYLAALPGQKGARYDLAPRELETRKREAMALIKAGQHMPPDLAMQLQLPYLNLQQACLSITDALNRINHRVDHQCEGFADVMLWRLPSLDIMQWQPYDRLADLSPELYSKTETMTRLETPAERMARLSGDLIMERIPDAAVPRLIEDSHRKVKVNGGEIAITIDGKARRYFAEDSELLATEGVEYLGYVPRMADDWLYLTDGRGRYLGKLPKRKAPKYGDREGMKKELAATKRAMNHKLEGIRKRNQGETAKTLEAARHNLEIVERAEAIITDPTGLPAPANSLDVADQVSAAMLNVREEERKGARKQKTHEARQKAGADALMKNYKA